MTSHRPLLLLGTLGALAAAGPAAAVDTSQWKCESCPYEKAGVSASVEAALRVASDEGARIADVTGLKRKGPTLLLGGDARLRGDDGWYGELRLADLGSEAVSLAADGGREGLFRLRLAYDQIPRHLSDGAATPFLGVGGADLTLPAGYPAASTDAMPLASSLQAVELGYKRSRLELGASLQAGADWTFRAGARHVVRDGTQRGAGSFFANAAQLAAPVDQSTDELELSAAYASRGLQATLGYQASLFRNADEALTWSNPFTSGVATAPRGQLALAPDNQFHQLRATLGYQASPLAQASGEVAVGRMTQDAPYLASTLNTALAAPALPASSLQGRVNTLHASLRASFGTEDGLRLNASVARDERDNKTESLSYPGVSTDMFLGPARSNQPYSFTFDRARLSVDYRGPAGLRFSLGAEQDARRRTLQEVGTTRELTHYARVAAQPHENLTLSFKLAHADRNATQYRSLAWVDPADNPLLRKYNMAARQRDSGALRADLALGERVSLGFDFERADDAYPSSVIGLTQARSQGIGGDVSWAVSELTQLQFFLRGDSIRSRQAGSQQFAAADWSARNDDRTSVLGLTLRHVAIKDKLELGADLVATRSSSDVTVDNGTLGAGFPGATARVASLKLFASQRLSEQLSLTWTLWHERWEVRDWRLDGVLPATVPNLLALGERSPDYRVTAAQVAVRYRF